MQLEALTEKKKLYEKKGSVVGAAIQEMIALFVGVGVAVMIIIFIGTLSGQTYQLVEPKIDAISNATIKGYIKQSAISGFSALKQSSDYLPIVVLAIVIFIVLALVLGFTSFGAPGGYRGGGGAVL